MSVLAPVVISTDSKPPQYAGPPPGIPIERVVGRQFTRPVHTVNVVDDKGHGFALDLKALTQERINDSLESPRLHNGAMDEAAWATFSKMSTAPRDTSDGNGSHVIQRGAGAVVPPIGRPTSEAVPYAVTEAARAPASPEVVTEPFRKVTYEVTNFGQIEAHYHEIIRSNDFLILVYDERYKGTKSFPRHSPHHLGMTVHGTDMVFEVSTLGLEFVRDNSRLCVLQIHNQAKQADYEREKAPEIGGHDDQERDDRPEEHSPRSDPHETMPGF